MNQPSIELEVITTIQVTNTDDIEPNQRQMGFMVPSDWWAAANRVSRDLMIEGLVGRAVKQWAAEDAKMAAEVAASAPTFGETPATVLDDANQKPVYDAGSETQLLPEYHREG